MPILHLIKYLLFFFLQAKDIEAGGNGGGERSARSRYLVLRVINDRVYSVWAIVYILLMSLLITIMMLYGEHIYKALGKAFSDEVKYQI